MCGIAGATSYEAAPFAEEWVDYAITKMAHRGPDGKGVYFDSNVALAHRRLSIIDLAAGKQPMSYADGRYWITFNGEIYNYRELRDELAGLGCEFRTNSDTEVILAAYACWGASSIERLNGIFAFGLWDAAQRSLLLARDHLGVKPLFYHQDSSGLCFSSELKILLAHPKVRREVDPDGLQDYLALGYVLAPKTILRDVRKLEPGHYLLAHEGKVSIHNYWELAQFAQAPSWDESDADLVQQFDALLGQTVLQQMVSDVPVGAFASGGLDSSSVVYYARNHSGIPLKTFTGAFKEAGYSEQAYAQRLSDLLETDHFQHVVRPLSLDELGRLVWYYDEPLGDTSLIPTYFVSRLAQTQVKVALSGDGGDELLAGYDTYIADKLQRTYARLPGWAHNGIQRMASAVPLTYRKVSLDYKIRKFIAHAHAKPEEAHFGWRMLFERESRQSLVGSNSTDDYSPFQAFSQHYETVPHASELNRALYVDMKTWLPDDILTKVDRASMACSLEVRVPLLSPRLVEFAMRLPSSLKLRGMRTKYILKEVMKDRLPPGLVHRPKSGFNAPIAIWMRDSLRDDINTMLDERASTLVDLGSPILARIWQEHSTGQASHGYKLWALVSLLLWEMQVLK